MHQLMEAFLLRQYIRLCHGLPDFGDMIHVGTTGTQLGSICAAAGDCRPSWEHLRAPVRVLSAQGVAASLLTMPGITWEQVSTEAACLSHSVLQHAACLTECCWRRWHRREDWGALIYNGMTGDLSWDRAAQDYEQVFNWALMDPPTA